jgi:hypothetical protein
MTPFSIFFAFLPALVLASPAFARGGANSAAAPLSCITKTSGASYGLANSNGKFRGSYGDGVSVFLQCYTTGTAYEGNS